jgi:hypothetical protein
MPVDSLIVGADIIRRPEEGDEPHRDRRQGIELYQVLQPRGGGMGRRVGRKIDAVGLEKSASRSSQVISPPAPLRPSVPARHA